MGLATAKRFVEEGAFVYITGRRQTELDKAVSLIGRSVAAVQGDVSDLADLDRLYAKVAREKGKIDIVFAGAGIVDPQPLAETTEESFDKVFAINARGLAFTVKKALPLLNDGGAIIVHDPRVGGHRTKDPLLLLDLAARAAATLGADAPGAVRLESDPSVSLSANARLRMTAFGATLLFIMASARVGSPPIWVLAARGGHRLHANPKRPFMTAPANARLG
jgi:NAD(P)-dependent dehydrogenase (short-subunit alcohol dehydrogenase family)